MPSGIYFITNTVNHKTYIGSSKHMDKRKGQHFTALRNNRHKNRHLQASFNKYGKDNFTFEIVEFVDIGQLDNIENQYLQLAKQLPELYYNLSFDASRPMLGKKHTEEAKRKCGNSTRGKIGTMLGKKLTLEQRQKVSNSLIGTQRRLDKTIYTFKNIKTNELYTGIRFDFINKYKLNNSHVHSLVRKSRATHKDWILI